MAKKMVKPKEDKLIVKQFKDGSSNFWCDGLHYSLNEDGSVSFCAGGIDTEERKETVLSFIRRNKKVFTPRELNIFETEEKEYSTVTFGKMSGKTTQIIVEEDKRYARWLYENTADKNIKEELKELLKIK